MCCITILGIVEMKIATRIKVLASIAALGIDSLIAMSEYTVNRVFTEVNYANLNSIPSISKLAEANEYFLRLRISLQRHVILDDADEKKNEEKSINSKKEKVDNAISSYKSLISDEKDKSMYEAESNKLSLYYQAMTTVIDLSSSNALKTPSAKQADKVALQSKLNSALKDADVIGKDVTKLMDQHAEYNLQLAKQNAVNAVLSKDTALKISMVFGALVLLTVLGMVALTLRILMRQLGAEPSDLAELSSNFAQGDLRRLGHGPANQRGASRPRAPKPIQQIGKPHALPHHRRPLHHPLWLRRPGRRAYR